MIWQCGHTLYEKTRINSILKLFFIFSIHSAFCIHLGVCSDKEIATSTPFTLPSLAMQLENARTDFLISRWIVYFLLFLVMAARAMSLNPLEG